MEKQDLSTVVYELLCKRYGSLAGAARELDVIKYERLKKSVQRNSFPIDFLAVVFPDMSLKELHEKYSFRVGRPAIRNKRVPISRMTSVTALVGDEDLRFLRENRMALERVVKLIGEECVRIRALFE